MHVLSPSRTSWLVDKNRIATKIKSASATCDPGHTNWKSNPSRACPNCQHIIDNTDVTQEWPGLPRGVKFDPSDQEIIWHLLTKVGVENLQPHPFIDEFIPTVNEDHGICYTHPRKLPGVKPDGGVSHFFHRAIKAYNTGTRKRRKIHDDDYGDVRWHKTGRTKPVVLDGIQKGCKKIMVLYVNPVRGGKAEKTNWVMHQYHLGTEEDEKEGEYIVSKVFYQQQQVKQSEKNGQEDFAEGIDAITTKVDPATPKSVTPEPPCTERRISNCDAEQESIGPAAQRCDVGLMEDDMDTTFVSDDRNQLVLDNNSQDHIPLENHGDHLGDKNEDEASEESKWWDSESQYLMNSQQLVEGLSLVDEFLQSQSPKRDEAKNDHEQKPKPRLSDYAHLGPENFKKDLEECQDLVLDPANIDLDTPPDFRLSQLEFASQESYIAWGASKVADDNGEQGGL